MVTKPRQAKKSSRFDEPCFCTSLRPLAAALMVALCNDAFALPTDPTVVSGQAAVNTAGTTGLVVNQSSPQSGDRLAPRSTSAPTKRCASTSPPPPAVTVNRVTTNDPSQILGKISALGSVFLINPSGIIFGRDAVVDVGSLVASTPHGQHRRPDERPLRLRRGTGRFGQRAQRRADHRGRQAGSVSLIGTQVSNTGTIATPGGTAGPHLRRAGQHRFRRGRPRALSGGRWRGAGAGRERRPDTRRWRSVWRCRPAPGTPCSIPC
jgi:filamentous hemagglutinin family protein